MPPEDVAAAACHSVAEQVFEQQLQEIDIKEPVIMVGGTSLIEGLVYAMGQLLQTKVLVPPHSQHRRGRFCPACIRICQGRVDASVETNRGRITR